MSNKAKESKDVETLISNGLEKFGFGDFEGALNDWRSALKMDPFNETAAEYITLASSKIPGRAQSNNEQGQGQSLEDVSSASDELGDLVDELSFEKGNVFADLELESASPKIEERLVSIDPETGETIQEQEIDVFGTHLGLGQYQPALEAQELNVETTNVGMGMELDLGEESSPYDTVVTEGGTVEEEAFTEKWIDAFQPIGDDAYNDLMEALAGAYETKEGDDQAFVTKATRFAKESALQGDCRWAVCLDVFLEETFLDTPETFDSIREELLPVQRKFIADATQLLNTTTANVSLDPKSAFLLSRIDGMLSADDLLDVSGMPKNETLTILLRLLLRGVVELVQ